MSQSNSINDYLKIVDADPDVPDIDIANEEYNDSFLSQIRKTRNNTIRGAKAFAEAGAKKYLYMPVYNDIKLLYSDVNIIMDIIKKNASEKNMIYLTLKVSNDKFLDGFQKLYDIWASFQHEKNLVNNAIFINKYWKFVENAVEMLIAALVQKTGICRENKLPIKAKNSQYVYEPNQGIYCKVDKYYNVYVWW